MFFFLSQTILSFEHYHRISPQYHHANVIFVASFGKLNGIVDDQVHEGIKSSQDSFNCPTAVDFQMDLKLTCTEIMCEKVEELKTLLPSCPCTFSALEDVPYSS